MKRAALIFAALGLFGASQLDAQARVGGQLSFGSDQDLGLGARLHVGLKSPQRLAIIGTFDWFFPDERPGEDHSYWELNGNLAYFFKVQDSSSLAPYAGGGLNIAHRSSSDFDDGHGHSASDTDLGLNLLGGTLFGKGKVNPFVEARIELAGGEQFVLTGGVLF
jgi:hypothetical protein